MGGIKIQNYPDDILAPGASSLPATYPKYMTKWLEFRAKVIYDFMQKARTAVKEVNSKIKFGVYVGGWYSSYYDVGVNWAATTYDTSRYYKWATGKYMNYGYAWIRSLSVPMLLRLKYMELPNGLWKDSVHWQKIRLKENVLL